MGPAEEGTGQASGLRACWQLNTKIERFFRTMKIWVRSAWMVPRMQQRLEQYRAWYSHHRVDGAHEAHTKTRWRGMIPRPALYTVRGGRVPEIMVSRHMQEAIRSSSAWRFGSASGGGPLEQPSKHRKGRATKSLDRY